MSPGEAQDLNTDGSPCAAVATVGMWHFPAFRGYVDLATDVEQGERSPFPVDLESESDCELE